MKRLLTYLLTLGGSARGEAARKNYDQGVAACQARWTALASAANEAARRIERLSATIAAAARLVDDRQPPTAPRSTALAGDLQCQAIAPAGSAVKGVVEGAATGLLASGLASAAVGACGTASTGAAIAGLTGAAKASATMAWFGGGSLAAGGGGVVAGGAVVGTLIVVPALVVMGWFSHAEAARLEQQLAENLADVERQVAALADRVRPLTARGAAAAACSWDLQQAMYALDEAVERERRLAVLPPTSNWRRWLSWPLALLRRRAVRLAAERRTQAHAEVVRCLAAARAAV